MVSRAFRIGQVAARAGVTPATIRYYERQGLLPPPERTRSGYRKYSADAVEQLQFIQRGKALGLRLADVREVLAIADGGGVPCDHVRQRLRERLAGVEERLSQLRRLRETLRQAIRECDRASPPGACRCAVIEGVSVTPR